MRFVLAILLLIGVIAAIGCASESGTTPQPVTLPTSTPVLTQPTATPEPTLTSVPAQTSQDTEREDALREAAITYGDAYGMRDWSTVHSYKSDYFQTKCPLADFAEFATFINDNDPSGVPMGATYVLEGVRVEGNYGWVDGHYEKDGFSIYQDVNQNQPDEPAEVAWVDGKWVDIDDPEFLSQEAPCDIEQFRGRLVDLPLAVGDPLETLYGRLTVTGVINDAYQAVMRENEYNDPPPPGHRFYMVSLEVEYFASATGPINISQFNFGLIGDARKLYSPFDKDCGMIPDPLNAELYPGGTDSGNICFVVSNNDGGFILVFPVSGEVERFYMDLE